MAKNYQRIETSICTEARACNCCGLSNYADNAIIYEIKTYNRINQGIILALCAGCLSVLRVSVQKVGG